MVFAVWAVFGFAFPAEPLPLNVIAKLLCFVATIMLFAGPEDGATPSGVQSLTLLITTLCKIHELTHQNYQAEKIVLFWRVTPVHNATHDLWVCAGIDGRPER